MRNAVDYAKQVANKANSSPEAKGSCSLFLFIMSVAYIAIGGVYLHDCPVQEMIPKYLIVAGAFKIILSLLTGLPCNQDSKRCLSTFFKVWKSLVSIFLFCWFIAGNYWIYSVFEPSYDKNGTDVGLYCNKTLYLFSFWTTTLIYIVLGFLSVICCCCCFCLCCFCTSQSDNTDDNQMRESALKAKESNSVV